MKALNNLLKFIDIYELEELKKEYINLHTKNKQKALEQCEQFFASWDYPPYDNKCYFYTKTSIYNNYYGLEYELTQSTNGNYWLKFLSIIDF